MIRRPTTIRYRHAAPSRRSAFGGHHAAALLLTMIVGLAVAQGGHAGHDAPIGADTQLGHVAFGAACEPSAAARVDRGLALMHHMMYDEARATFEEAAAAEPGCAMAHWGIATTLFQPLWPSRPSPAALERGFALSETARASVSDGREAALIEATAAFFADPETADYWTRVARWADGMAAAYGDHGSDLDVAALYALSRVAIAQVAPERGPLYDEAESVLRDVFERSPLHPGAIHYAIHATDVEGRAGNALDKVAIYGEIAPQVPHALHMPTHIYVRLGDWPGVIDWNRRSADAALLFPAGDYVSLHHVHALDYMLYGYLQQGDDDAAMAVLREALDIENYQDDFAAAFHLAIMPARLAVERRDWEGAAGLPLDEPAYLTWDRYAWPQATTRFARGLGAAATGAIADARDAEAQVVAIRDRARDAGEMGFATFIEIDRLILSARIARAEGEDELALELLREAADVEGSIEKHPISPGALLPPYEALGDLLFELERFDEALDAYRASDARWPQRYNTLLGAARAADALGDTETARAFAGRLLDIAADSPRPTLAEAAGLATN